MSTVSNAAFRAAAQLGRLTALQLEVVSLAIEYGISKETFLEETARTWDECVNGYTLAAATALAVVNSSGGEDPS
jgi:hypothetical protein